MAKPTVPALPAKKKKKKADDPDVMDFTRYFLDPKTGKRYKR